MSFFHLNFLYRPYKGVLYEKRHSRNTEGIFNEWYKTKLFKNNKAV